MASAIDRQLNRWLVDLHAVEHQAAFQLRRARRLAGEEAIAADLDRHLHETERHRAAIAACLAQRRAQPSHTADLAATLNRLGFLTYGVLSPDTAIRLLVDSVAYEYLEIAAYRLLERAAGERGAWALAATAAGILADEQAMAGRLEAAFDRAIDAVRRDATGDMPRRVLRHLRDAHALETQAITLLGLASRVGGSPVLADLYRDHAAESVVQRGRIAARLRALGSAPAPAKTGVMALAGAAWAGIWALQRDTPVKLGCFSFAALHLEIASYEVLRREAARAGDQETEALVGELLSQEQAGAERLGRLLDQAPIGSPPLPGSPLRASA